MVNLEVFYKESCDTMDCKLDHVMHIVSKQQGILDQQSRHIVSLEKQLSTMSCTKDNTGQNQTEFGTTTKGGHNMQSLMSGPQTTIPSFYAVKSRDQRDLAKGERIMFETAITNVFKSYDIYSGVFKVPLKGAYAFTWTIAMNNIDNHACFSLFVNDVVVGQTYLWNNGSDAVSTGFSVVETHRYREALSVLEITKVKLAQPYLMYESHVDRERFTEAVGGQSWSTKMRQAVAKNVILDNKKCYIHELIPEQQCSKQMSELNLYIPPSVLLHMLEFISSRHVDTMRAQAALDDLQVLVHHDQGLYVPICLRDISWEILGICQHIAGNLQSALYSYQQSLKQLPQNEIQTATRQRIHDLQF
uniref:Uncharacterized protein n=1 Tax=Magallana gigas TaxID=29159 RepID=K1PXG1_MAGGI